MTDTKPVVLFLCTANTCRSQLAEALLRHLAGDRYDARSAGLEPGPEVHPLALRVLEERGISTEGLKPKSVRDFLGFVRVRWAVFVCARAAETCPVVWPDWSERIYWPLDDPATAVGIDDERLTVFRRVRDELESRILAWLATPDKD